ncbi:MAG: O-antigen ligase family protein [Chitinispirillaceae bacterium]|nr:O-antigen ligase family protein [Chitinispirillaceae bacterium]
MQEETTTAPQQRFEESNFYFLKIRSMYRYMKTQHFSFWMISLYLFFEYTRPQAIFPAIDFLPWTQLLILGAMIGAFLDGTVCWVSSRANVLLIIFAIVIFISSLTAFYPEISRENYISFYSWFVIYFLIITIVNSRERFYIFIMIFILSSAKIAIGTARSWVMRGFSFTTWGLMGPKGYFQNSGELAILMLTLFPIVLLFYTQKGSKIPLHEKIFQTLFFISPMMTVMGASSRGAQIALAAQLLVLFRKKVFKIKWLLLLAMLITAGYYLLPTEQKLRFTQIGEDKTSIQRKLYWKHGWEMIKEHPVIGVGFFNFPRYYSVHYYYDMLYEQAQLPHNIFIQVGTDAGFAGLLPFSLILLYTLLAPAAYCKHRKKDDLVLLSIIGTGYGIFGFIIAGQFVTVTYYPFLWIGLSFIVAGKNILQKEQRALQVINEEYEGIEEKVEAEGKVEVEVGNKN